MKPSHWDLLSVLVNKAYINLRMAGLSPALQFRFFPFTYILFFFCLFVCLFVFLSSVTYRHLPLPSPPPTQFRSLSPKVTKPMYK